MKISKPKVQVGRENRSGGSVSRGSVLGFDPNSTSELGDLG